MRFGTPVSADSLVLLRLWRHELMQIRILLG